METNFYEAFNQTNVRLVDLLGTPIVRIEEHSVKTSQENVELDILIYATGFSASKYPGVLFSQPRVAH
jgi:NADH dehydrogenase FAD-containing subunit